jgi:hypothetical protein
VFAILGTLLRRQRRGVTPASGDMHCVSS